MSLQTHRSKNFIIFFMNISGRFHDIFRLSYSFNSMHPLLGWFEFETFTNFGL